MISDIEKRAITVATIAHAWMSKEAKGRFRKYSGDPYIVHPAEVAEFVRVAGGDEKQIAVGWLHDVIEDTHVSEWLLLWVDPSGEVLEGVGWLSDVSKPEDGNREARKAIDRAHSWKAPARWKSVKCADLVSNLFDIEANDPHFAKVYREEKRLLLEGMRDADLPLLREKALALSGF